MWWGPGGAATVDTNLYRSAAAMLRTDQGLYVGNGLTAVWGVTASGNYTQRAAIGDSQPIIALNRDYKGSGQHGLIFGLGGASGVDTNLYRSAAGQLTTDGGFNVGGVISGKSGTNALWLTNGTGAGYAAIDLRVAADTNDRFSVYFGGQHNWGPGNAATDTNLYRLAAARLATDGMFTVGNSITVTPNIYVRSDTGHIYFGVGDDANIYRNSANALKIDGGLIVTAQAATQRGVYFNPATPIGYPLASQISGEAQPRFYMGYDGRINWGPGGATAPDTNLYRSAAGQLKTDGRLIAADANVVFLANPASTGAASFMSAVGVETQPRWEAFADGRMYWGPGGTTAVDTNLYRSQANVLATDGGFLMGTFGVVGATGSDTHLYFGSAYDTNLYRAGAGSLKSDGTIEGNIIRSAAYFIANDNAVAPTVSLGYNYNTGSQFCGIGFTSDTNLYRSAANNLKTDGSFTAGQSVIVDNTNAGNKLYLGGALDTYLYRHTATQARVSTHLVVEGFVQVDYTNSGQKLFFGSAADTNLYRAAANALKTDGVLQVGSYVIGGFTGTVGSYAFISQVSGDSQSRWICQNNGGMQWGPGNAALDTQMYRYGVNQLANYNGSAWGTFFAAAFSVQSDRHTKKKIEQAKLDTDKLLDAGVYTYERDDTKKRHLGLLADELPDEVLTTTEHEGESLQFVDLYKLTAALLATVQRLNKRIETLEAQGG
jgi:hypothetical protein